MPQLAPQSGGLIDTITAQKDALTSLTQTVARGVPALRDAAENVLELNPATSTPLLTSNANDVGASFSQGILAVVDQTGQGQRPLTAELVIVGDGTTQINEGGFSGPSATLTDYLYATGVGNSSVFVQNGDVNATGIVRGTGATFGGVDIGNGGGMNTNGRTINVGASQMDTGGLFGNNVFGLAASFGGIDINNGGIATHERAITCGACYTDGARIDSGGVFGNAVNGFAASFGGVDINNGGLATGGRAITCGACYTGGARMDGGGLFGNVVNGFSASFGGTTIANNTFLANGVGCNIANFGATNAGVLSYTALVPPPSERVMKAEDSLIRNGLDVVRLLVPARWRWREQPRPLEGDGPEIAPPAEDDTAVHASVYVDEVAEVAPELIVNRPDGARSYDDRGLIAYLISAVQTLADRNDALTARLDALEATA